MERSSINSSRNASAAEDAARWRRLKPLPRAFYERNTLDVARDLLGKVFLVETAEGPVGGRIVETEAYRADDEASHSARGETPRASIMFGDPGFAYVYFIYGMYEMINFVTEPKGEPGAVLVRALEPVLGETLMAKRRSRVRLRTDLTSGPGKLCRAMGIRISDNGESLQGPRFKVVDDGSVPGRISASPRVGITLAAENPWRFFLTDHSFVSRVPQNKQAVPLGAGRLRGGRGR